MTIAPNSQYNSAQPYLTGQMVLLGSLVYQAVQDVPVETSPPNGTYWTLIPVPQAPLGGETVSSFAFSHSTGSTALAAGVATGIVLNSGDLITAAWFEVDTAFNGTTPLADFGSFSSTEGLFKVLNSAAVDMTAADGAVTDNSAIDKIGGAVLLGQAGMPVRCNANGTNLTLVVSETGAKGGTASGATAGAAILHVRVLAGAG
jgi:hypothetical protein